jgi:phosphoribosylglycinamide formyltransferase-1
VRKLLLGVFVSGRGSNFKALVEAIENGQLDAEIKLLLSSNAEAGAISIAQKHGIPTTVISKQNYSSRDLFVKAMLSTLDSHKVEFIALAGYMKKIPTELISAYKHRIVNIHPAILPMFGGKGMYGHHVHEAVLTHGCKITGVTVHIVDEIYDHGPIVAQRCIPVLGEDNIDTLAARVLKVEHELYWETLQLFAQGKVRVIGKKVFIND